VDISIVVPALNEESKIRRDIDAAYAFVTEAGLAAEIIIVADGSTDRTHDIATAAIDDVPILRVLPLSDQRGKGAAIRRGFAEARGAIAMFADAGLCVPFSDAHRGLALLKAHACDIAHGSRSHPQSVLVRMQPGWRRMGSRVFRYFLSFVMGIPWSFGDTQCGFKLYRLDAAHRLYADLFTPGYMFDIEIILRARKLGYKIAPFPVTWSNDADSRLNPFKGAMQIPRQLLAIRYRLATESAPSPVSAPQEL
jgi:glycosyltransferase involved in cell wall biosynthesis